MNGWGCYSGCDRLRAVGVELHRWGLRLPTGWSWQDVECAARQGGKTSLQPLRLLCYVVYQCWRAQNAKVHNREVNTPLVIAATIVENLTLFDQGCHLGCWGTSRPFGHFLFPSWCPPPPGWIKVNVDGSLLPSRSAGLGIVVRSEAGAVLMAAGFAWQHWDPGRIELEAIVAIRCVVSQALLAAKGIIIKRDVSNVLDFCSKAIWGTARLGTYPGETDLAFLTDLRRCGYTMCAGKRTVRRITVRGRRSGGLHVGCRRWGG
ncbi:hypothetical protein KSP40_PGU005355 [Platanthera guangdongensis]|uniref:RNase H type-1 domain-containing protein n=1 Tax=Platanthera guangdongensis TaxID=2320717 RepID=A0ABR2M2G0_9ASPA